MNQFQKTPEEREAIKAAKKAYKGNREAGYPIEYNKIPKATSIIKDKPILTGILKGEHILNISFPVYYGFVYLVVFNDMTAQVMRCDIEGGNIRALIYDLIRRGEENINHIRNCKLFERNLL